MANKSASKLRRDILQSIVRPKLRDVPMRRRGKRQKTPLMLLLEEKHGRPIEELLLEGTIPELAERLEVSKAVISLWWQQLGIPSTKKRRKQSAA